MAKSRAQSRRKRKDKGRQGAASPKANNRPARDRNTLILALLIGALGFLAYANTLGHGFVLDDFSVIEKNRIVTEGTSAIPVILSTSYRAGYETGQRKTLFRPLSLVVFAIGWELSPNNPQLLHWIIVLFYALTGIVLMLVLRKLFRKSSLLIPLIAAGLFIVHPVHTEVVANIKSLDEVLMMLFSFLSLGQLLNYYDQGGQTKHLVFSLSWLLMAILSKESALTMVGVFPLAIYFFRKVEIKKIAQTGAFFLAPAIIYLLWRIQILGDLLATQTTARLDNSLVAVKDFVDQKATALSVFTEYMGQLFFPTSLVHDGSYDQFPPVTLGDPTAMAGLLILLALIGLGLWGLKKRAPWTFGIWLFLATFSLTSNLLILIGTVYAERLLFFPSLGLTVALALLAERAFKISGEGEAGQSLGAILSKGKIPLAAAGIVMVLFAYKTIERNPDWESETTLYEADVDKAPRSCRMAYRYGMVLSKDLGQNEQDPVQKEAYLSKSVSEFKRAIAINPSYTDAWEQMGVAWTRRGQLDSAITCYNTAIQISNRTSWRAFGNRGAALYQQGQRFQEAKNDQAAYQKYAESFASYRRAVFINKNFEDGLRNLGITALMIGRSDTSVVALNALFQVNPNDQMGHAVAADAYTRLGNTQQANYHRQVYQQLGGK